MPSKDYSHDAFLEFLRQGAVSGTSNPATARARKQAAQELLGQLTPHERKDMRVLDVDDLCSRFHKLEGSTIRPESLQLYNDRLTSGLKDFIAWTSDPINFTSVEGEQKESVAVAARDDEGQARAREELVLNPPRSPFDIFPVPLREDLVVYLQNIPLDLSQAEARKIAAVVQALAVPDREE